MFKVVHAKISILVYFSKVQVNLGKEKKRPSSINETTINRHNIPYQLEGV